jgi:hypothetical protein
MRIWKWGNRGRRVNKENMKCERFCCIPNFANQNSQSTTKCLQVSTWYRKVCRYVIGTKDERYSVLVAPKRRNRATPHVIGHHVSRITVIIHVRFEVYTAVTMKNGVFWVVTPCGSCKNRRFGGVWRLLHQGDKNR